MKFNLHFSFVIVVIFSAQAAAASDLRDCRQKIFEIYRPFARTEARELSPGADPARARLDSFHMSADNACGVEVVEDKGYVRVIQFERADTANARQRKFEVMYRQGSQLLGIKKFETIKLDESNWPWTYCVADFEMVELSGFEPTRFKRVSLG